MWKYAWFRRGSKWYFLAKKWANFVTYLVSWHRHCHHHHLTLCAYCYDLAWTQRPVELEVSQPHEGDSSVKKINIYKAFSCLTIVFYDLTMCQLSPFFAEFLQCLDLLKAVYQDNMLYLGPAQLRHPQEVSVGWRITNRWVYSGYSGGYSKEKSVNQELSDSAQLCRNHLSSDFYVTA